MKPSGGQERAIGLPARDGLKSVTHRVDIQRLNVAGVDHSIPLSGA
jgi:hypothetical protein